jgi:DNA-directed RNA polymerase II subunit RPB2
MTSRINSSEDLGRRVARRILNQFFTTQDYPYTRHHIDSYDQFLSRDLISIFQSQNPVRLVKERVRDTSKYAYNIELYVGGLDGTKVEIGTPVVNLDAADDVRMLFPNEARLRNLTYAANVKVDILVRVIFTDPAATGANPEPFETKEKLFEGVNLFKIPIMLHSRFCHLHGKPKEFLIQAGECPYDNGGYFIVDGAEKVLIARQEQAFNTLYVTKQESDEKISTYANVISLSPKSRRLTFTAFAINRTNKVIYATLPMVRAPVNIFILFRALGIQSDEAITRMIFPDLASAESQFLADKLIPTIINAYPFLTTTLAVEYIKSLTKGFSIATVLDILKNKLFTHVDDTPGARATYLAECIRSILKVENGFESSTSRDDTRNQRCLTSGFLVQDQFTSAYDSWMKAVRFEIDTYYNYNKTIYSGLNFMNIFADGNRVNLFKEGMITDQLNVGFKGKWGSGLGEEKTGVLQALSRLSYLDFMSHCRRVVLNFDTSMKLTGPRKLHGSQYGFFCTNETPNGASIGITKNLTVLATISTGMQNADFVQWLYERGGVVQCSSVTADEKVFYVPVALNNGIVGFTSDPLTLLKVLKAMKHTGFLPSFTSIAFSYSERRLLIFTDEGRPLRPLIVLGDNSHYPIEKIASAKTWKELLIGTHPRQPTESVGFIDPLKGREGKPTVEDYLKDLEPYKGCIEYIDPYEQNEILISNYPEHIIPKETTHVEIHPSTILSILTTMIPYANHNQSPRNQLSDSQSKQSISIYATNWKNRYDSSGHIACYGDAPISRTLYYDYLAEGRIPYGNNVILAIAMYEGYNQDDGFVINKTALERGLFRTVTYRSYEFYEEDDDATGLKKRIGNPAKIGEWLDIKPGLNYLKLDERGIVKIGEYVDEDTVLVGGYYQMEKGKYKDASVTAKVWTRGIVEDVIVTVNNKGLRLVKVRVVQDRIPELGDKFSNRHGQKGTIGAILPATDLPRSKDGIVPDIIANPHAIPSRMTMAMLLETLLGKTAALHGAIGDATPFMNEGNPADEIGAVLENQYGYERYSNEVLYDGISGKQMEVAIFIGPAYYMRLKHMVEDKWQARTNGRKEAKTHQPTGGRGNEGGIRFGELERDSVLCHGTMGFLQDTIMNRSDGAKFPLCTGCGTIPIYNPKQGISICPLCQGPVKFAGNTIDTLELIPPIKKQIAPIIEVEMPYCMKLLDQEMITYANMPMRFVTTAGVDKLNGPNVIVGNSVAAVQLPELRLPEVYVPEIETVTISNTETMKAVLPRLEELADLAKKVGMTLVPETSAMARSPEIALNNEVVPGSTELGEKIVEGSANEEVEPEVQILPGALPPTSELKVLGSRAPITSPRIIPPAPAITSEQMANFIVNAAINQPHLLQAAATQAQAASAVPSGPTVIVDTSPNALAADGLMAPSGLRAATRRNRTPTAEPRPKAPAPAPAYNGHGPILVNKLG